MWWRYDSTTRTRTASARTRRGACFLQRLLSADRLRPQRESAQRGRCARALKTNPACMACHVSSIPAVLLGSGRTSTARPGDASEYTRARSSGRLHRRAPASTASPAARSGSRHQDRVRQPVRGVRGRAGLHPAAPTEGHARRHRSPRITERVPLRPSLRSLVRSVVADPNYRTGSRPRTDRVTLKMVTPDLLGSVVKDLTGFDWRYAGRRTEERRWSARSPAARTATSPPIRRPERDARARQQRLAEAPATSRSSRNVPKRWRRAAVHGDRLHRDPGLG